MPSVTTIINAQPKPWITAWHEKWGPLADKKLAISGKIGNEFHRCVEQYLDTGSFTISDGSDGFPTSCAARVTGMVESFIDWAVKVDGVVHETELKVVSRTYTYSGTFDAVGALNGKPVLFDWKTTSRIYDDMALQLSAYSQAYKEERGLDIKDGLIVHVSKAKPRFKLTTKMFRLSKRVFNKFLKLREMFDDMRAPNHDNGALNA